MTTTPPKDISFSQTQPKADPVVWAQREYAADPAYWADRAKNGAGLIREIAVFVVKHGGGQARRARV